MEQRAIILFTRFTGVNILYRTNDGEYFTRLSDAEDYVEYTLTSGAYTTVERVDPLPPVDEEPDPSEPIWVLINDPLQATGLRYDGVVSFSAGTIGGLGEEVHQTNKLSAFRAGNYILAISRTTATAGQMKYGKIIAISGQALTIDFEKYYGEPESEVTTWDIVLTGERGDAPYLAGNTINGATTTTISIKVGSVVYNISAAGTYTDFKDYLNTSIVVTGQDLIGKVVQLRGKDGVFEKVVTPVLNLIDFETKYEQKDRNIFEHVRGTAEITGNAVFDTTQKSGCVYEVMTKTGQVSKITLPFYASANNTVELRIFQGTSYSVNLSSHTLIYTKVYGLGEFNTSSTVLTTLDLPLPISVTEGDFIYVALVSTTGTTLKIRYFNTEGTSPARHRFLFSNNVDTGTAWSAVWTASSVFYYSASFKLEYINKEINGRVSTSLLDAKLYADNLVSSINVRDSLFGHPRGDSEISGNAVFTGLKSGCFYEVMTKTGQVSKLTLPIYGSAGNTVELRIYQGNTFNLNLSTHTLLATKNYTIGGFNTSSEVITTVDLSDPIFVLAGRYLYIAVITTTGPDLSIRYFNAEGSSPARHLFLFNNNVSSGTAWSTAWTPSSPPYYSASFKLEYLNPDITSKFLEVKEYADSVAMNSVKGTVFEHVRGSSEISGNTVFVSPKSGCIYDIMTKTGKVSKITLPIYGGANNTVELRIYQGDTYNVNLSVHTLLATKNYALREFNTSSSELTTVELNDPISVVAGKYLYVAVLTTTGTDMNVRYFNVDGSAPVRRRFLFSNNVTAGTAWSTAWIASSVSYYSASFKLEFLNPAIKEAIKEVQPDLEICIPSRINAIVGRELILYYENFIFGNERGEQGSSGYTVAIDCPVGKGYRNFYKLTALAGEIGTHIMSVAVYDSSKRVIAKKSVNIVIKAFTPLSSEKNILLVGDSLTAPSQTVSQLETIFSSLGGVQPIFRGTQTGGKTEGRPGWTFSNFAGLGKFFHTFYISDVTSVSGGAFYTNNSSTFLIHEVSVSGGAGFINCVRSSGTNSPDTSGVLTKVAGSPGQSTINYSSWTAQNSNNFWNGTELNINYYRTSKLSMSSGTLFDLVSIQLGINDINPDPTGLISDSSIIGIINYAKALATAFIADGTHKIIINLPPACNNTGGGFLKTSNYEYYIQNMRKLWAAIVDSFDNGVFHATVEVGFTGAFVHRYHGYPISTVPVSVYAGVVENVHTNSVHPNDNGYKEVGNGLFHHILSSLT